MAAITYGSHAPTKAAVTETKTAAKSAPKTGFFARLWNAMVEARMKQAMAELRLHQHLLPAEYEIVGNKLIRKTEDQLPFAQGR